MNFDGYAEIGEIKGIAQGIEWQKGNISTDKLIDAMKRIQELADEVTDALRKKDRIQNLEI